MKILSFMFIMFLFSYSLFSQNQIHYKPSERLTFEHITEDDGLSNNHITCILQDSKGYMWFGTAKGLNRYDGYEFIIYKHDKSYPNTLKKNYINALYEDSNGMLWIGAQGKDLKGFSKGYLYRYNSENDQFKEFLLEGQITSITEDNVGKIIICTRLGINVLDNAKNKISFYTIDKSEKKEIANRIKIIYRSNFGTYDNLWIGTEKGLYNTDYNLNRFTSFMPEKNNLSSISGRSILSICEDKQGNLWIGTEIGGLNKYDSNTNKFKHFKHDKLNSNTLSHNKIQAVFIDNSGLIWVGTKKGLNKFFPSKNKFTRYYYDRSNPYNISDDNITSIYEDNSGVIWIGTYSGGVNKVNKQINQFGHYYHNPADFKSLGSNLIRSVFEDSKGAIWIGTHKGLDKFDVTNENFIHYRKTNQISFSISSNIVWDINEDNENNIWIGTFKGGLNKFNPATGKFKHFKHKIGVTNSLSHNNIRTIFKDSNGIFWIGTFAGGLNRFDPINEKFTQYINNPNDPNSISSNRIESICETKDGLWIGTQRGGLNKFDTKSQIFEAYRHDPDDPNSLSNDNIWSIYEDKIGELWISTRGGLNRFNRDSKSFTRFKFDTDSIANDISKVLFEDSYDNLWVGNNSGLYNYDRENNIFNLYGEKYSIPEMGIDAILEDNSGYIWFQGGKYLIKHNPKTKITNVYNLNFNLEIGSRIKNSYLKCSDGKFIFSGLNGFILFDPEKIEDNKTIPNITITDFQIFNKSVEIRNKSNNENEDIIYLDKHISESEEIKIPYDKDVFSIEFSALDFRNPSKNKYAYKLEGVDPDWVYTDASRRFATYNQLNPDEYTFYVKGTNNDGIWNEKGKSLKIIITPLWWQTIWFRLFAIVLIIGIVLYIFYNRIQTLKKKQELQEKFSKQLIESQESERKRIASALHDSHGQNLLVISNEVQYFVNEHKKYEKDLKPVTKIVQESIDEIRTISYDLHPHQLDKLGLVKTIKSMYNKVGASSDISFSLNIDEIDNLFDKKVEINIYRILQEATNNIIKHSEASEVNITIKKEIKNVNIDIEDNGRGFNKKEKLNVASGLGLSGMQERVKLLNGKFHIETDIGSGVTIQISIPFKA